MAVSVLMPMDHSASLNSRGEPILMTALNSGPGTRNVLYAP